MQGRERVEEKLDHLILWAMGLAVFTLIYLFSSFKERRFGECK